MDFLIFWLKNKYIFEDFVPVSNTKMWYYLSDLVPVQKVNLEYLKNKNLIFHLLYRY